jgi:hypothetical protein
MARVAIILLIALVAGTQAANAMLALCDSKAKPATPLGVKVTRNTITPKGAGESLQ